jgi:hypothetical protein
MGIAVRAYENGRSISKAASRNDRRRMGDSIIC